MIIASIQSPLGDEASIKTLQETLKALGKDVYVNGLVDGWTQAALFEIIRDKLPQIPRLPAPVKAAFSLLKPLDSVVSHITFGRYSISDALKYQDAAIALVKAADQSTGTKLEKAMKEFAQAIDKNANYIQPAIAVLAITTAPKPPPAIPANIYIPFFGRRITADAKTTPQLMPFVARGLSTEKPFYKKTWFWATVGGVVVLGGGAYLLLRK